MCTDRFDILAKADGTPSTPGIVAMLHALLMERFNLAAHTEEREGEVYDLMLARSDGRFGPTLRPSTVDCAAQRADAASTPGTGIPIQLPACPVSNYPGKILGTSVPVVFLARTLVVWVDGREVRDRTGLTGLYDIELTWTPERLALLPPNVPDEICVPARSPTLHRIALTSPAWSRASPFR